MSAEFVPFVPAQRARTAAAPATFTPHSAPSAPAVEPKIQVKRSGERITHIQIDCRCGEHIEIECEY